MQMHARPALPQRIVRLLRAKEFLVFYSIGLAALDFGGPLLTGWLRHHRPLPALVDARSSVAGDAVAGHTVALLLAAVAYLLASTILTSGYLRSLLGKLHWGPRDGSQFGRMLVYTVAFTLLEWGTVAAAGAAGTDTATLEWLLVVQVAVSLPLLYAGYAIIASNVGPLRAVVRSLRTFAANIALTLLVLLGLLEVGFVLGVLAPLTADRTAPLLPALVVHVLVWGSVSFLADVVLLSVYIDTIERGTLPPG